MIHLDEQEQVKAMRNAYNREYHRKQGRKRKELYWQKKLTELIQELKQAGLTELASQIEDCTDRQELDRLLDEAFQALGGLPNV